jgi:hypothetical protein
MAWKNGVVLVLARLKNQFFIGELSSLNDADGKALSIFGIWKP